MPHTPSPPEPEPDTSPARDDVLGDELEDKDDVAEVFPPEVGRPHEVELAEEDQPTVRQECVLPRREEEGGRRALQAERDTCVHPEGPVVSPPAVGRTTFVCRVPSAVSRSCCQSRDRRGSGPTTSESAVSDRQDVYG